MVTSGTMQRLTVAMLLLTASAALQAEEGIKLRPGMMGVADIGGSTCKLFNDMHPFGPAGMEHHVLTFAQGYIYAQAGTTIDGVLAKLPAGHGWDFDSLTGFLVDYCAKNPDELVGEAAVALAAELGVIGAPSP